MSSPIYRQQLCMELARNAHGKHDKGQKKTWPRLFCILKIEKKIPPPNRLKNHVLASGTYLDRSGMVDLPRKSSIRIFKAPRNDPFRPIFIFIVFLRVFCVLRSVFFCLGASYFFSEISTQTIFSASWTHLDRSGVPWSYRLLPSIGAEKSSNVKVMKRSHFFFARSHFFFTNLFFRHTIAAETFSDYFRVTPLFKSY